LESSTRITQVTRHSPTLHQVTNIHNKQVDRSGKRGQ